MNEITKVIFLSFKVNYRILCSFDFVMVLAKRRPRSSTSLRRLVQEEEKAQCVLRVVCWKQIIRNCAI
jgi:hypothetical protein